MPLLSTAMRDAVLKKHAEITADGTLPRPEQIQTWLDNFQARFSRTTLEALDGEPLLKFLHGSGSGLTYWLEFKTDEEFNAAFFGGIRGSHAGKFRVYERSGTWMAGDTPYTKLVTLPEAIAFARENRDMFVAGLKLLESLPADADDAAYANLQADLFSAGKPVFKWHWGHKLIALLHPQKLCFFHLADYAKHILRKLQIAHGDEADYAIDRYFVRLSDELNISMGALCFTLRQLIGKPVGYYKVGTKIENPRDHWPMMRDGNCVAVGWNDTGPLNWLEDSQESKDKLRAILDEKHPAKTKGHAKRQTNELFQFVIHLEEGDIVAACDGQTVLGIGRITGPYEYHPGGLMPHRRPVEWLSLEEWKLPEIDAHLRTIAALKRAANLLEIERRIHGAAPIQAATASPQPTATAKLEGEPLAIQGILDRKRQVILYGPPGTGKTHWAEYTALRLAASHNFGKSYEALSETDQKQLSGPDGFVRWCTFHPSFGYEDFLEGYRPQSIDGQMVFELRDGIFKRLCRDAARLPDKNFYLIIDEINRGDIPRIFGELLTVLEATKRGKRLMLPSGEAFAVPANVYLIGTMNTADRSIALLDVALRRRFGFHELMPDTALLKSTTLKGLSLGKWLAVLNEQVRKHAGEDGRNLQIGHAFFLDAEGKPINSLARFTRVLKEEILPLLMEYCYEDYSALKSILGEALVDTERRRIKTELLLAEREEELLAALLQPIAKTGAVEVTSPMDDDDEPNDEVQPA